MYDKLSIQYRSSVLMWFSLVMLIDTDRQLRSWGCLYYFNRFEKGGGSQFDWYFFFAFKFPDIVRLCNVCFARGFACNIHFSALL